jgi:hypothetical protein
VNFAVPPHLQFSPVALLESMERIIWLINPTLHFQVSARVNQHEVHIFPRKSDGRMRTYSRIVIHAMALEAIEGLEAYLDRVLLKAMKLGYLTRKKDDETLPWCASLDSLIFHLTTEPTDTFEMMLLIAVEAYAPPREFFGKLIQRYTSLFRTNDPLDLLYFQGGNNQMTRVQKTKE